MSGAVCGYQDPAAAAARLRRGHRPCTSVLPPYASVAPLVPGLVTAAPTPHPELRPDRCWDLRGCLSQVRRPPRRHFPLPQVRRPPASPPPARLPFRAMARASSGQAMARCAAHLRRLRRRASRLPGELRPGPGAGVHGHGAVTRAHTRDQQGSRRAEGKLGHGQPEQKKIWGKKMI